MSTTRFPALDVAALRLGPHAIKMLLSFGRCVIGEDDRAGCILYRPEVHPIGQTLGTLHHNLCEVRRDHLETKSSTGSRHDHSAGGDRSNFEGPPLRINHPLRWISVS